jgi:hypothetical protein
MNRTEHKAFAVTLGVPEKIYDEMNATHEANNARIRRVRGASMEELDEIIERTAYAEHGVAIGDGAREDQDLRRLAQAELGRRIYGDEA